MAEDALCALVDAVAQRLFVPIEASGRHVHLTEEQSRTLFGHPLTPERPLSQPGQYLARERVTLIGTKGTLENVAVLGPARKQSQVEISLTDGRTLGVTPPVRLSGDIAGSPGIRLAGTCAQITLPYGVIAAKRHIHMTPQDAQRFGVTDGQTVRVQTLGARSVVFDDVTARVSADFSTAVHLDFDEANACGFHAGDLGRLLPCSAQN